MYIDLKNDYLRIYFDGNGILQGIEHKDVNLIDNESEKNDFEVSIDGTVYYLNRDFKFIRYILEDNRLDMTYQLEDHTLVTLQYILKGRMAERRAFIKYTGDKERVFNFASFILPGIRIEGKDADIFNSPGQGSCFEITSDNINFRPHIRVKELENFETKEDMFSTTPDKGDGILTVNSACKGITLAAWAYSLRENFFPMTRINNDGVDLIHRNMTVFYMDKFREMEVGVQYIELADDYYSFLSNYREYLKTMMGIKTPDDMPEWVKDGAILEIHINQVGDFEKGINHLDSFKEIGIRTIYLLPCLEYFSRMTDKWRPYLKEGGSPYAVVDYHKIDPMSGGEGAFSKFVKAAHDRGIRILFDLVPQGAAAKGDLYKKHPDWFEKDREGNFFSSHGWRGTYSLDWANEEVQQFFIDIAKYYVKEFDIDGFRMDAPHWKEPNMDRNLPYHSSYTCFGGIRLLSRIYEEVMRIKPDLFILCELWGVCYQDITHAQCEYNVHWMLYNVATGKYTGRDMQDWMRAFQYTYPEGAAKVLFLETHDTKLLSPKALPLRGSKVTEVLFNASMFMGHLPMVWYPELESRKQYLTHMLKFRREQLDYLEGEAELDRVYADSEDVFAASRNKDKNLLFLANFSRETKRVRMSIEKGYFSVDPDRKYKFVNLYKGEELDLYRFVNEDRMESYREFYGRDIENIQLYLEPSETYWLEIAEA